MDKTPPESKKTPWSIPKGFKYTYRSSFPSIDDVAKQFIEENYLSKISSVDSFAQGTLVILEDGSRFMMSVECPPLGTERHLRPYVGGGGGRMYTSEEQTYRLSGTIGRERVDLTCQVSVTEDYEKKPNPINPSLRPSYARSEKEKTVHKRRIDNNDLFWFITKAS